MIALRAVTLLAFGTVPLFVSQSRASPQGTHQEVQAKRPELLQTLALALSQKQKQQQQQLQHLGAEPLAAAQDSGGGNDGNGQQPQVRMLLQRLQGFQKRMQQGQGQGHGAGGAEPAALSQQAGGEGGGRDTAGVGAREAAASAPEEVDLTADGDDDGAEVVEVGEKRRLPAGAEGELALVL